jgi:hypothetical protein
LPGFRAFASLRTLCSASPFAAGPRSPIEKVECRPLRLDTEEAAVWTRPEPARS